MASSGNCEALYQLAQAAGVSSHWCDHRGEDQVVSPEILRAVLTSLDLPAANPRECQQSLEQLKISAQQEIPSLTTGRSGERLILPPALQTTLTGNQTIELNRDPHHAFFENGAVDHGQAKSLRLRLERTDKGELCLPAVEVAGYYRLDAETKNSSAKSVHACLAIAPSHCTGVSELTGKQRNFGLAAQIYSLRSSGDGGIGNYTALKNMARACGEAGAQALATSPVHALFSADETRYSPYAPSSRLFLNVLYIDPAAVLGEELFQTCITELALQSELIKLEHESLIHWPHAARAKLALLRCMWMSRSGELMGGVGRLGREFIAFCNAGGEALQKHAVFETLHAWQFQGNPAHWHWRNWPQTFQNPENATVKQFAVDHQNAVGFHSFLQWLAAKGLSEAQTAGREAGLDIGLIADLAIGTDSGGSHAWSRQTEMLNGLSVGAPPDMLSHRGQNWGLTTFSPRALKAHDYRPFLEMLRASLRHAGGLRIDHVLGLRRLWLVPEGAEATQGAYLSFPQTDLLNLIALESWRHNAIVVGEDLGTVPQGFRQEISDVGLLGMQVMWFEQDKGFYVDPSRWRKNAIATTTTHDLPTVAGWWRGTDIHWNEKLDHFDEGHSAESQWRERTHKRRVLWAAFRHACVAGEDMPPADQPQAAVDSAVAFVAQTPSTLALLPVEDILGLSEQPNLPGTIDEHPNWRRRLAMPVEELLQEPDAANRLAILRGRCTTQAGEDKSASAGEQGA